MKVIIYTNSNNAVSVCVPTGEIPIEAVLAKDAPQGAIIVDDSVLPQADNDFFDAWQLNNGTVSVNLNKAKTIATNNLNASAKAEVNHRATNTGIGIANKLSDADWLTALNTARTAISSATSTQNLRDAVKPINDAITANK